SSTEEMWDEINIAYLNMGKPLLYGLATDDSHHYHKFGQQYSNAGRGWVMVKAERLHPHDLIASMEAGDFYSTTGVEMEEISFNNNELSLKIKPEAGIDYQIQFIAATEDSGEAQVVKTVEGTKAAYKLSKNDLFVRAKV